MSLEFNTYRREDRNRNRVTSFEATPVSSSNKTVHPTSKFFYDIFHVSRSPTSNLFLDQRLISAESATLIEAIKFGGVDDNTATSSSSCSRAAVQGPYLPLPALRQKSCPLKIRKQFPEQFLSLPPSLPHQPLPIYPRSYDIQRISKADDSDAVKPLSMAYHNHHPNQMVLPHFAEHQLDQGSSVLRSILPEPSLAAAAASDGKDGRDIQRLMQETSGKAPGGSGAGAGPTWLSNAIVRQQGHHYAADGSFLHLQTASDSTASGGNPWVPRRILQRNASDASDSMIAAAMSHGSGDLNIGAGCGGEQSRAGDSGGGELAETDAGAAAAVAGEQGDGMGPWQSARYKANILAHPLYEQLLSAHVACLRIATPVDQLPRIDAQLAQSQHVVAKYSVLGHANQLMVGDDKELDQFMFLDATLRYLEMPCSKQNEKAYWSRICLFFLEPKCPLEAKLKVLGKIKPAIRLGDKNIDDKLILADDIVIVGQKQPVDPSQNLRELDGMLEKILWIIQGWYSPSTHSFGADTTHYVLLLCSFKEQLQQHVRVHAMEAVMACWELEQSLQSLTGVSPGEGTGATMSDDDDEQADSDVNLYDGSFDGSDSMGFGPLIPTESERSLMERVRQELKHELKQGYKEKIVDIREEILRKRRAGKLPGDTTSTLKAWWQSHSKWPYPTV
ncbi:hypothetical protein ACLOJK_027494 [Asimina triloba]